VSGDRFASPPRPEDTGRGFRARLRDRAKPGGAFILAHRGASALAPENTLEAARVGHAAGADAWELDVQRSRDGIPIVLHDESLARTTDVRTRFAGDPRGADGYLVSDFDLEELRQLDAGSWFVSDTGGPRSAASFGTLSTLDGGQRARFASGHIRIPTLAEALALTKELDWLVNVELKSFPNLDPGLLDATLAAIAETGTAARVLISSFDHDDVRRTVQTGQDLVAGVLASSPIYRPEEYVRRLVGAECYHPSANILGSESDAYRRRPSPDALRRSALDSLRAADVPVLVYTVNDYRRGGLAQHLVEAGVRGLFTDHPGQMVALFRKGG
jgi:glycerophosphoryl diester phosphodiesterase